jgi:hypothetical protein
MKITRFRSMREPVGLRLSTPVAELFGNPSETETKDGLPQWAPVHFADNHRKRDNVQAITAFASDVDEWGDSVSGFRSALELALPGAYVGYHTTMRATAEALRWRIVVAIDRELSRTEFLPFWRAMQATLATQRVYLDPSTKDPSKAYLWPAKLPGGLYHWGIISGASVPTQDALQAGERILAAEYEAPTPTGPVQHADKYAQAAIDRECENVRTCGKGTRNATLSRSAFALARLSVPQTDITQALTLAAREAGLEPREITTTIHAAFKARRRANA